MVEIDFREPAVIYTCIIISFFLVAAVFAAELVSPFVIWWSIAGLTAGWFLLEHNLHKEVSPSRVEWAAYLGIFLMAVCFLFHYGGALLGLFGTSHSSYPILNVPLELMLAFLFGGAALYIYLPRRFDPIFSLMDITLFAFLGAIGEAILIRNGMMAYSAWWTPAHAFAAYACIWVVLHWVKYGPLTPK